MLILKSPLCHLERRSKKSSTRKFCKSFQVSEFMTQIHIFVGKISPLLLLFLFCKQTHKAQICEYLQLHGTCTRLLFRTRCARVKKNRYFQISKRLKQIKLSILLYSCAPISNHLITVPWPALNISVRIFRFAKKSLLKFDAKLRLLLLLITISPSKQMDMGRGRFDNRLRSKHWGELLIGTMQPHFLL